MPLLPGKKNVGTNIHELMHSRTFAPDKPHWKRHEMAVAAAAGLAGLPRRRKRSRRRRDVRYEAAVHMARGG